MTGSRGDDSPSKWWQEAVFYQVYPLSFQDTNDDGYGDLQGIIDRLDYLSDTLGIDALWLSPFYRSPMRDWGYDVSDHCAVDPIYGDLTTARKMIEEIHSRGMRVIVDYVLNHTSDQHDWFIESRSSRSNPRRDWYVWSDGRDDGPPNNWVSVFSGPAWSFDEHTGQWYRHTYLPEQPDLNWRNPEVVEAMMDVVRFWLDLGVDGFRVDAAHQMMKDPEQKDNPPVPPDYQRPWKDMGEYDNFVHLYDYGHPDVHEVHKTFRDVVDTYQRDVVTVGEIHVFDLVEWASYYGPDLDQFHMPFNFHLMAADWDAASVRAAVEGVLWTLPEGGWTNWTLGNHDEIRMATRLPDGEERLAALLLLTLRGTPFLYYGDELGMEETEISASAARDPWGDNVPYLSRDGARTPMQWNGDTNAGFTSPGVRSWLPVSEDSDTVNVEYQSDDPDSMLNMYRAILTLRKGSRALRSGTQSTHPASTDQVYVYTREAPGEVMTMCLNFDENPRVVEGVNGRLAFSTHARRAGKRVGRRLRLEPGEGMVVASRRQRPTSGAGELDSSESRRKLWRR